MILKEKAVADLLRQRRLYAAALLLRYCATPFLGNLVAALTDVHGRFPNVSRRDQGFDFGSNLRSAQDFDLVIQQTF
jgi:hypothetical protein